jgi:phage/plasmid-associated DNA primase
VDRVLLGRHGAHGIIGEILDQVFLLIHGQRGTEKSTFSDICMRLFGTYVTAGSTTMFMRQNDKRSFELGDTAGKRGLFVPETLKGMTIDEVLICEMLGGVELRAERKYVQRSLSATSPRSRSRATTCPSSSPTQHPTRVASTDA